MNAIYFYLRGGGFMPDGLYVFDDLSEEHAAVLFDSFLRAVADLDKAGRAKGTLLVWYGPEYVVDASVE